MRGVQHSSAMDIPFKHYTAEIPRKPPAHPRRDSGTLYCNHRRTSNNDVNSIMWSVRGTKKEQKNKTEHYARVFSCCDESLTLFDPQKVGEKAQPMSFISSSSLCYTCRKKTFYTWAFTSISGWGFIRVSTWAERDLLRPSSW